MAKYTMIPGGSLNAADTAVTCRWQCRIQMREGGNRLLQEKQNLFPSKPEIEQMYSDEEKNRN